MKTRQFVLASLASLGLSFSSVAQQKPLPFLTIDSQNLIASYHLGVGFQKTTHLIFPGPVTYVDLGSGNIIADKAQGAENIVKVKANAASFAQTNMTVLTADGKLYSFLVDYERDPKIINVNFAGGNNGNGAPSVVQASKAVQAKNNIESTSADVATKKRTVRRHDVAKDDITLGLHGLYTADDLFYFQMYMFNKSNIGYDIDFVKFYVRDKKTVKRTAVQESEVTPRYVYNSGRGAITGNASMGRVYVYPKFTIPDDKVLVVEMFEKGGGRHLSLNITNQDILKARVLSTPPATVAAR
ncbi:conjugative transposon protein TraN [Hymenobacter sp. GOD-10R]|uniref:conjugative transposon protein TraN n=1 Tax=Hymenobacter sp. GOD-10R TaxID=3093922 RepID=UPI002D795FE6|nr:conjugative transposon protein TraN [Hymenobacter sp. GOD-10R]WRQ31606.1 conjugative transposon protein TraN [Hymenobacter sp. GOD-10R]